MKRGVDFSVSRRVPPMEGVQCCLCGGLYDLLGPHLRSRHKITVTDYRSAFPGAETASDDYRTMARERLSDRRKERISELDVYEHVILEEQAQPVLPPSLLRDDG